MGSLRGWALLFPVGPGQEGLTQAVLCCWEYTGQATPLLPAPKEASEALLARILESLTAPLPSSHNLPGLLLSLLSSLIVRNCKNP